MLLPLITRNSPGSLKLTVSLAGPSQSLYVPYTFKMETPESGFESWEQEIMTWTKTKRVKGNAEIPEECPFLSNTRIRFVLGSVMQNGVHTPRFHDHQKMLCSNQKPELGSWFHFSKGVLTC